FWTDKNIDEQYGRIMAMDYELLKVAVQNTNLIARNKMIMTGLVHLLLTIYNASDISSETKQGNNSKRSRMLLNHFFELVGVNVMMGQRDVSFYAKKLCISERYLSKLCKAETGKTPKILINQSLIGEIKNALLTTEMSHQQIADRFGFPDQSAFGQFFKRQEGISPSEFRKMYK
ncbi:MAG: AraC family transcriptional regulator, partial [Bacteroidales bacterium]|nr:AraC family transcriptional regulator [Bacteroidales bacterium]